MHPSLCCPPLCQVLLAEQPELQYLSLLSPEQHQPGERGEQVLQTPLLPTLQLQHSVLLAPVMLQQLHPLSRRLQFKVISTQVPVMILLSHQAWLLLMLHLPLRPNSLLRNVPKLTNQSPTMILFQTKPETIILGLLLLLVTSAHLLRSKWPRRSWRLSKLESRMMKHVGLCLLQSLSWKKWPKRKKPLM